MSRPFVPVEQRFWTKVVGGDFTECWIWTAGHNVEGYGRIKSGPSMAPAHRVAYELMVAPIPPGLDIDHLCRVPACVNPWHLEPVTRRVNILRGVGPQVAAAQHASKTHCKHGHPFDERNTYITPKGRRNCRACHRAHGIAYRARQRAEEAAA